MRRTRKQKEKTNYPFLVSWKPDPSISTGSSVKGQFKNHAHDQNSEANKSKSAHLLDKNDTFDAGRPDLVKSLILASFIVALELMIYLGWK